MNIGLKYLLTFLVSMAPIVELRGAVPFGVGMGLRVLPVLIVCIIGNMIPVPFIALFIRKIFAFLRSRSKKLDDLVSKIELRAHEKAKTIKKYERWGLYIFVAIPLPGTGAWTGRVLPCRRCGSAAHPAPHPAAVPWGSVCRSRRSCPPAARSLPYTEASIQRRATPARGASSVPPARTVR